MTVAASSVGVFYTTVSDPVSQLCPPAIWDLYAVENDVLRYFSAMAAFTL